jgi:hypothetical protein
LSSFPPLIYCFGNLLHLVNIKNAYRFSAFIADH